MPDHGAVHARGIAEQHVHLQVYRIRWIVWQTVFSGNGPVTVRKPQQSVLCCLTDHAVKTTFPPANRLEYINALRQYGNHIPLLSFVAPQLHR